MVKEIVSFENFLTNLHGHRVPFKFFKIMENVDLAFDQVSAKLYSLG